ncbi:MAG TPA: hypothetical protein VJH24_03550 [Candidatus Bilamarchaeaceae archaeon]|nr:hypothetical protein [Candidatus Bilamarchaeaceae archaeon]
MPSSKRLPWPPVYDQRSDRLRGFYPKLIASNARLSDLMKELQPLKEDSGASRVSVRAVVHRGFLPLINHHFSVEAEIPAGHFFDGCSIAYIAWNGEGRADLESVARQKEKLARLQTDFHRPSRRQLIQPTEDYTLLEHPTISNEIAERIARLFAQSFRSYPQDMSTENIRHMPEDHFIVTAHDPSYAVDAVFMAECTIADIDGKWLPLFEFNHVVATNQTPHQALIPLMAYKILEHIAHSENPIIFAEARADTLALQAACLAVGMRHCGTMLASFQLQDLAEQKSVSPYKNAHVWHLPGDGHG